MVVAINGDRLNIKASVDAEGLKTLLEVLKKYEPILEMTAKLNKNKKEAAN